MDSWCENSLFFLKTVTMATASVPKCCFVVMETKVQDMDRSPWGFILLWLHLCSVLLCWFHTVILILLCSLLHTHCHLCLHSHPHPLHISHPKSSPFPSTTTRLGQPLQPHPSQPVRRLGGPAGPSPAGGAGQDDAHVPVEGGHRAGLAGGCHGDAHVHPQLFRERQERKGRPDECTTSAAAAAAKTLAFCRFCSGWQMKTWSWV